MTSQTATILLTRPAAASAALAEALRIAGVAAPVLICPAFEYVEVPFEAPGEWEAAIFTSARAVQAAGPGAGRAAWCVGAATADAAREAGFVPREGGGDVERLIAALLEDRPEATLCHFRGEESVGDVAGRLLAAGLRCAARIVYRKADCDPTPEAKAQLRGEGAVILPLFSPQSARIVGGWRPFAARVRVVAISAAVADAARGCLPDKAPKVAAAPTQDAVVAAICALVAAPIA